MRSFNVAVIGVGIVIAFLRGNQGWLVFTGKLGFN